MVANNACGSSAAKSLTITRNTPATPGTISGLTYGVCNSSAVAYSVTNVVGRTYNWSFNTANASVVGGQGTNAITANFNSAYLTGIISVTASNACGTSAARSATVRATPATPGTITGSATVCANQSGVPYSIIALPNVTSYYWYGPSGSHVSDGISTSVATALTTASTAVTVNFGVTAGNLHVRANNACGAGSYKSLLITTNCFQKENKVVATDKSIKVSPNPATTDLNVSFYSEASGNCTISLKDVLGKTYLQQKGMSVKGNNKYTLNIEKLTKGIYSVEVINSDKKNVIKVVVD